jgi:hypothetical protein
MRPMTNAAGKNSERRGTGGASAPGSKERLRPPRTPSKTENAEIDKEDHIKEREDLSEDLSDDEHKKSD